MSAPTRRRTVATQALAAFATPAVRAQPAPPRVVVLSREEVVELPAFRDAMRELGWVEGRSYAIEERHAGDDMAEAAAAAVRSRPAVIFAAHSNAALEARRNTSSIPIVFIASEPVRTGLVASLARPGGNATGISQGDDDLVVKRIELLHDAFPTLKRFAFLHLDTSTNRMILEGARLKAVQLGIELIAATTSADAARGMRLAVEAALAQGAEAVVTTASSFFHARAAAIAVLMARHRLPAIFDSAGIAEAGGLMSYGPDRRQMARRIAHYVDRILKGAKPADLPVEQQTRLELVINLRTADALGLTIPPSLIALADRVIE